MNFPIVLLHGLSEIPLIMVGIEKYLKYNYISNIHYISYDTKENTLEKSINQVNKKLIKLFKRKYF